MSVCRTTTVIDWHGLSRQTRFEAALPQLLQLLSELLRRHGGGTGETGEGSEDWRVLSQRCSFREI